MGSFTRRSILKGIGAVGLAGTVPMVTGATDENRFIVDTGDGISASDRTQVRNASVDVVHELDNVGYMVVRGSEDAVEPLGGTSFRDLEIQRPTGPELPDELGELPDPSDMPDPADMPDPEVVRQQLDDTTAPEPAPGGMTGSLPFDDAYAWDKDELDVPDAHSINTGIKPSGDPVRVGIIDDGVFQHSDLDVVDGINLTEDGNSPYHPNYLHYHGTHVAGCVASSEVGVAPDAELVSLRFFGTPGTGFFGDFIAAVDGAIATDCDVINASLGFPASDITGLHPPKGRDLYLEYIEGTIEDLTQKADSNGIVWVASAGNGNTNSNDRISGVANADDVISVSATGPTGISRPDGAGGLILGDPLESPTKASSYTTYGDDFVDVSGPGGSWDVYPGWALLNPDGTLNTANVREYLAPDAVLSTFPPDSLSFSLSFDIPLPAYTIPDTSGTINYAFLQGTSMASPEVAGVAALLIAENPDWSPHEVRQVVKATARDVGPQTYHGHGFVDPVAALNVTDPSSVRGELGSPGSDGRNDAGRDEFNRGPLDSNPRNPSGGSGSGSSRSGGRGSSEDDEDGGSGRDSSR